jgi:hypothetical protein
MRTPERDRDDSVGLGAAAKQIAERSSNLVRLELELAAIELKTKASALAVGIALGVVAVVVLLYALGFALAGGAAGLATVLPTWAALLVVAGLLVAVAILLALFAAGAVRRGTPPVPQQAIEEAKITSEALKSDGRP